MSHFDMGAQKWLVKGPAAAPAIALTGPSSAETIVAWMVGPAAMSATTDAEKAAAFIPIVFTSACSPFSSLNSIARRIWFVCATTLKGKIEPCHSGRIGGDGGNSDYSLIREGSNFRYDKPVESDSSGSEPIAYGGTPGGGGGGGRKSGSAAGRERVEA